MPGLIRIVIADDEPIYRAGLHKIIAADPLCRVVGEGGNAHETLRLVDAFRPDIVLVGNVGPSRTLTALRGRSPSLRTVVLARRVERATLNKARRLGARGLLLRTASPPVLFRCLRTVAAGRTWMEDVEPPDHDRDTPRLGGLVLGAGLTHRELEVVSVIVEGASNKDIAHLFAISENTVKHHLTRIFDKVGVSSRLELAVRAAAAP